MFENLVEKEDVMGFVTPCFGRRTFFRYSIGAVLTQALPAGTQEPIKIFVDLSHNDQLRLYEIVRNQWQTVWDMGRNVGNAVRYRFETDAGTRTLECSFVRDTPRHPPRLRLMRSDGVAVFPVWGEYQGKPAIRFTDMSGPTVKVNGRLLEYPITNHWRDTQRIDDVLTAGILGIMAGLTLWIGVPIIGHILATLGILVFYALVIGLFVVAVRGLARIARRLLHEGGWERKVIDGAFQRRMEDAGKFFDELTERSRKFEAKTR